MRVRLFYAVLFLVGVVVAAALIVGSVANAADSSTQLGTHKKANIVFIFADNLGYGEIGSSGGGILRGNNK
ncbi:MAG: hypothetical protein ACREEM_47670 [Blastocatellia bacterium]